MGRSLFSEVAVLGPRALLAVSMKGGVGKTTTAIGLARARMESDTSELRAIGLRIRYT